MRNTRSSIVIGLIGLASMELLGQTNWTRKARMPTARSLVVAYLVGGRIYCTGGGARTGVLYPALEQYDPSTDTWTNRTRMPTPRSGFDGGVVNGKIYAIGGGDSTGSLSVVEEYDPATDAWRSKAPMPTARGLLCCGVVEGKIYAIAGVPNGSGSWNIVEAYDVATDTWTKKANMPSPRVGCSCSTVNGRIYAIGGISSGGWEPGLATVEEYDSKPTVSLLRTGSTLRVCWNGILESSDTVNGPNWQALNPATWPYSIGPAQAGPMKFYRARQP